MIYTVQFPLLKTSVSLIEIKDQQDNIVGYLQRYHATRKQRMINLLLTNVINNIYAFDQNKKVLLNFTEVNNWRTLVREKWEIDARGQTWQLENKTMVKTNPQFLYKKKGDEIWGKKIWLTAPCDLLIITG